MRVAGEDPRGRGRRASKGIPTSIRTYQTCLFRLYQDRAYRRRFGEIGGALFAREELEEDERASLAALDAAELDRFAESLLKKRLQRIRRALPRTAQILGRQRLLQLTWEYQDRYQSVPDHCAEEIAAFEAFARAWLADRGEQALADLVAFEAARHLASDHGSSLDTPPYAAGVATVELQHDVTSAQWPPEASPTVVLPRRGPRGVDQVASEPELRAAVERGHPTSLTGTALRSHLLREGWLR